MKRAETGPWSVTGSGYQGPLDRASRPRKGCEPSALSTECTAVSSTDPGARGRGHHTGPAGPTRKNLCPHPDGHLWGSGPLDHSGCHHCHHLCQLKDTHDPESRSMGCGQARVLPPVLLCPTLQASLSTPPGPLPLLRPPSVPSLPQEAAPPESKALPRPSWGQTQAPWQGTPRLPLLPSATAGAVHSAQHGVHCCITDQEKRAMAWF